MSQYNSISVPIPYASAYQQWVPTLQYPYPMNFVQAPSPSHQILVHYNGKPNLQGLSIVKGPVMFPPFNETNCHPNNSYERKYSKFAGCEKTTTHSAIMYPTTHSIPGPFLQSYIALPRRMYPY